ncbi:MAG: endolytic transglycosylase MltG [Candidatus Pacebacteria bacterium]|nr:endolytic transglycosylase MltG [Candidatus Paceibacterota bacterium]
MTTFFKTIVTILVLLIFSCTAYYFYDGIYNCQEFIPETSNIFEVGRGQSAAEVAADLKKEGVIQDPYPLLAYLFVTGEYKEIKSGKYLLSSRMAARDIAAALVNGDTAKVNLTFIEGWDLRDMAQYLREKNIGTENSFYAIAGFPGEDYRESITPAKEISSKFDFLKDKPLKAGLEGYLFPDTYQTSTGTDNNEIISLMLANFGNKLTSQMKNDISASGKTIYETITMASIIEKEVKTLTDKKIAAGILWKRLDSGMPLQTDASVLYGLKRDSADKIYLKDLQIDSPYNTYLNRGLPLGPICNPGIESIKAAIYPVKSDYWYYLSAPDGTTIWSKTLAEHNAAKNQYLK